MLMVLAAAQLLFLIILSPGIAAASGAGQVTNYPTNGPYNLFGITAGPDGNLWFTEYSRSSGGSALGSITPSGTITSYPVAGSTGWGPLATTAGPDGNIWFTGAGPNGYIGRLTTSGDFAEFTAVPYPYGITSGPDGNLWFATDGGVSGSIGRINPLGTVTTLYSNADIDMPHWIAAGPDGALWFTNNGNNSIGRITRYGVVKDFTGPGISSPEVITPGPDGAMWFTNPGNNSIGRITMKGKVTNYTATTISEPEGITAGPDGALWFTNNGNNSIGRITRSGVVSNYTGTGVNVPEIIAPGPDGALWFPNYGNASVGRITTRVTPQINSFTPQSGAPGTTVTIKGLNLSGATVVAFNGTAAPILSDTATQIATQVPAGATAGPITVTTPTGTATSAQPFT
jgi:virginiamycin B lyase